MKYLIEMNFHVFLPPQDDRPETKQSFGRGQVIEEVDIPDGQSGDDWVAKGLATVATAAVSNHPD